jgi:hypothetical protein
MDAISAADLDDDELLKAAAAEGAAPALARLYLGRQKVKQERRRWLQHWGPPWSYPGPRPCDDCDEIYDATGTRIPRCPTCREARRLEVMRTCQKRRRRYRVALDAAFRKQTEANLVSKYKFSAEEAAEAVDPRLQCQHCQQRFQPRRQGARFCSTRCRVAAHRARKAATGSQP